MKLARHTLILCTTFAAACGSGTLGGDTPQDTVAPTVVSTLPAAGATEISVNTTLTVTFSEEVDPATVNAATLLLEPSAAADISALGARAVVTPQAPLALDTSYTATVTTGVTDVAGNPLAVSFSWSFSTGSTVVNAATLTWEAPTTNADGSPLNDLAGYKIYSGTTSRNDAGFTAYDDTLDVGNSPICAIGGTGSLECTHVMQGFAAGTTVYFTVTAYDVSNNESGFSNEGSKAF